MRPEQTKGLGITLATWSELIEEGASSFGLALTDEQLYRFFQHADILVRWNRNINLTTITESHDIAIKHFVDSLGPVRFLHPMNRVLDIGSGGGFPGLPIKVWCPSIELTMIDAVRKKTTFLQQVIRTLGLEKTRALHIRLEELLHREVITPFDTIVCRAFGDLATIFSRALPLLAAGGKIAVWKGRQNDEEIEDARTVIEKHPDSLRLSFQSYRLPFFNAARTLVILSKEA